MIDKPSCMISLMNLGTVSTLVGAGRVPWLMASWLREGRQPPQAVLGIIVGYLHRVARPTYLGTISLHVGWSLARTQEMMEFLQDGKIVVPLTAEEKRADDIPEVANVWRLVERPSPGKARW